MRSQMHFLTENTNKALCSAAPFASIEFWMRWIQYLYDAEGQIKLRDLKSEIEEVTGIRTHKIVFPS